MQLSKGDILSIIASGGGDSTGRNYFVPSKKRVIIEDAEIVDEIELEGGGSRFGHRIEFRNCRFIKPFILATKYSDTFDFERCQFDVIGFRWSMPKNFRECVAKRMELFGFSAGLAGYFVDAEDIYVEGSAVNAEFLRQLRPKRELSFYECQVSGVLSLGSSPVRLGKLELNSVTINDTFKIEHVNIEWLRFKDVKVERGGVVIEGGPVAHVVFDYVESKDFTLEFFNVRLGSSNWKWQDHYKKGSELALWMVSSIIGRIKMTHTDWSQVRCFIADVRVHNLDLLGSTLPNRVEPLGDEWKEVANFYGQLERYSREQGAMADAITYRSWGLRAYRKYLYRQRRDWLDQLTLLFSERISDYGSNWLRSLTWLFCSGFIGLAIIVALADDRVELFTWHQSSPQLMLSYFSYYLEFLSPLHARNFLGFELEGWPRVLDAVFRVWHGFVIYQVIRSTRKFVS